jgi:hypothetical protein
MIHRRKLGLALVAVFAMSAVSVAVAASHEFVASKEGTVKDKQLTSQKFKTNGGVYECEKETSEGKVKAGSQQTSIEKLKYSECTGFGVAATVSEAELELSAEGSASVLNKITIAVPTYGCKLTIEPSKNSGLPTVSYTNLAGGKLEVKLYVKHITYKSSGGSCGSSGENGEYAGSSEVELPEGTLEWK